MRFLLNATTWQNGCGLATLSHLLTQQLNTSHWKRFTKQTAYQTVLNSFSTVYQKPELNWHQVNHLMQSYLHPHDQQMLWIPPLRLALQEILLSHHDYRDRLFHTFYTALRNHIVDDKPVTTDEYINIYQSNLAYFNQAKSDYEEGSPRLKTYRERRLFQFKNLERYWKNTGYILYCQHLGQYQDLAPALTAEELSILCESLFIRFRIRSLCPETNQITVNHLIKGYEGKRSLGTLNSFYANHHWQPITQSESIAKKHAAIWHKGIPHFHLKSLTQIKKAISKTTRAAKHTPAYPLHSWGKKTKLSTIAQKIEKRDMWFLPKGPGRKKIHQAIQNKDLRLLITFSHFNPFAKNYVITQINGDEKLFFQFNFLTATLSAKQLTRESWDNALDEIIPIVDSPRKDSKLHQLIRSNQNQDQNKQIVRAIKRGKNIYQPNGHGITPIHLASAKGNTVLLKAMIKHERDKSETHSWFTRNLNYRGLNLNAQDIYGENALHHAAKLPNAKTITLLLDITKNPSHYRVDLKVADRQGKTPLHVAAKNPDSDVLKAILAYTSSSVIDQQDEWGMTALHYAVATKNKQNIDLLLTAKADSNISAFAKKIKTRFPQLKNSIPNTLTPLWLALEIHAIDLLPIFVTSKEHLAVTSSADLQAPQLAVIHNRKDLLKKWFKQFGSSHLFSIADKQGRSILHTVAMTGNLKMLKYLLSEGGKLTCRDKERNTPLHLASMYGNKNVVKYLCKKANKFYFQFKKLKKNRYKRVFAVGYLNDKINKLRQLRWRSNGLLKVNIKNKYGETPLLHAVLNKRTKTAALLIKHGAKETPVYTTFMHAIYNYSHEKHLSTAKRLALKVHQEERAAMLAGRYQTIILNKTDKLGNTLVHHCVKAQQYRMLHILLHPLSPNQKRQLCAKKNRQGLTALALLKKWQNRKKNKLNSSQRALSNKVERLLLRCDPKSYAKLSLVKRTAHQYQWNQDLREEVMSSSWYQNMATGMLFFMPIYRFGMQTMQTGNPWLGMEAAISEIFNVDPLDWAERGIIYSRQYLPNYLQGPASFAQFVVHYAGMYKNTTQRLSVEALRQFALLIANHMELSSDNYVDQINYSGVMMYLLADMAGRYIIGPKLSEYIPSLESYFTQTFGFPTIDDVKNSLLIGANNKIAELTGIDVAQSVKSGYQWARVNIGNQLSAAAMFQAEVADNFMAGITLYDKAQREFIQNAAQNLYVQYFGDANILNQKLAALSIYANTGMINESTVNILVEVAHLLTGEEKDFSQNFAELATITPFFKGDHFSDDERRTLQSRIQENAATVSRNPHSVPFAAYQSVIQNAHQDGLRTYSAGYTDQALLPLLNITDASSLNLITQGLTSLVEKHIHDDQSFDQKLNEFIHFMNFSEVTPQALEIVNEIALISQDQGKDYQQALSELVLCSPFYQALNFDAGIKNRFANELQAALRTLNLDNNCNAVSQLTEALNHAANTTINAYASTRANGLEAINDYKNKLRPANIKPEVKGRAEEVTWSLVHNNPLYFANKTPGEIDTIAYACIKYLSEIQGSERDSHNKHDSRAAHNYNTLNTFMVSQLFVNAFMSSQPLDENTRFYLLSCDPIEIRAAFAVHEANVILSESAGYQSMHFEQQLSLYRELINVQHDNKNHKKEESAFRSEVWNALQRNAVDWNNYQPLWGAHSIDEIASYVADSSKLAGENHWQGSSDSSTRPIHSSVGMVKRVVNSVQKRLDSAVLPVLTLGGGVLGVGAITNGISPQFGVMNLVDGDMSNFAYQFGKTPTFEQLPMQNAHTGGSEIGFNPEFARIANKTALEAIMAQYPVQPQSSVMAWLDSAWNENLAMPAWQVDEKAYVAAFAKLCEEAKQTQPPSAIKKSNPTKSKHVTFVTPETSKPKPAGNTAHGIAGTNKGIGQLTQLGVKLLELMVPKADAAALVASQLAPANAAMVAAHKDPKDQEPYSNPLVDLQKLFDRMNGKDPDEIIVGRDPVGHPISDHKRVDKTQTLADQPGNRSLLFTFPAVVNPVGSLIYFKKSKGGNTERVLLKDRNHKFVKALDYLPGFPDATEAKAKTPYGGGLRRRWKTNKGKILEWDAQHGEIEMYDRFGNHLGAYDPKTGERIKIANKNRSIKKYL